jgi:class 3 adenylate cyclase
MTKLKASNKLSSLLEQITNESRDIFLLNVDLSDSTGYKERCAKAGFADVFWVQRQLIFLHKCEEFIRRYNGTVFKTVGDSVFAHFVLNTNPEQILKCAIEIVQGFDNLTAFTGLNKIEVKISIDYGLTYNGALFNTKIYDPIGTSVDRCSRLNSTAGKNEIVLSDVFWKIMKSKESAEDERYTFSHEKAELKGLGQVEFYKVFAGTDSN